MQIFFTLELLNISACIWSTLCCHLYVVIYVDSILFLSRINLLKVLRMSYIFVTITSCSYWNARPWWSTSDYILVIEYIFPCQPFIFSHNKWRFAYLLNLQVFVCSSRSTSSILHLVDRCCQNHEDIPLTQFCVLFLCVIA